jgi:AraC-like DNA-binding protein
MLSLAALRALLRARDTIDRASHEPMNVDALACVAGMSRAHFIRSFKQEFGATPHQYLMTRRIERAKALLRTSRSSVTDVCFEVGFSSLGSFGALFQRVVGESPTQYRAHARDDPRIPSCIVMMLSRPSSTFREARRGAHAYRRRCPSGDLVGREDRLDSKKREVNG